MRLPGIPRQIRWLWPLDLETGRTIGAVTLPRLDFLHETLLHWLVTIAVSDM